MSVRQVVRGGVVSSTFTTEPQVSTNQWAVLTRWGTAQLATKRLEIAVGGNAVAIRISGSLDGGRSFPHAVQGSASVSTAGTTITLPDDYYTALLIEMASATNGQHGTITINGAGASI